MHEIILTALKTKYKDLGLSDTILKAYADKIERSGIEESEIQSKVDDLETDLKVLQSFSDQNRTLQKEIKGLKDKLETKAPEPEKPEPSKGGENGNDKGAENELLQAIKDLKQEVLSIKTEKIQQTNAEKLTSKLKDLGVKETFYKGRIKAEFENDEQLEAYALELKADEDAYLQSLNIESLKNQTPPQFGEAAKSGEVSPEVKAFIASKQNSNE